MIKGKDAPTVIIHTDDHSALFFPRHRCRLWCRQTARRPQAWLIVTGSSIFKRLLHRHQAAALAVRPHCARAVRDCRRGLTGNRVVIRCCVNAAATSFNVIDWVSRKSPSPMTISPRLSHGAAGRHSSRRTPSPSALRCLKCKRLLKSAAY
jgi:hypothetical protein